MITYRECNLKLRIADGSTRSIEGYGDLNVVFRSGNGLVQVLITNVAYVTDLRYHLFSLPTLAKNGHTFEGRPKGVVIRLRAFGRVSVEWGPIQPLWLPGRPQ